MSNATFDKQLIRLGEKQNIEQLQELINRTSIKELTTALTNKLGRHDCIHFWNYLLHAFDLANYEAREKRFACVKAFLDGLLKIELTYKQTYDLITRLCHDLNTFSNEELIEVLEHCTNGIREGDPKYVSWKDLMPETLNMLAVQPQLNVNGILMTGGAYRDNILSNLSIMRWATAILTPIADMFKELHLSNDEMLTVLKKFSGALQDLSPMELPALAYQLFSMCNSAAHIVMPIMALEKYFNRYYYKKLFSDMLSNSTDFDSIDAYSDKELREAEETILNHLNYCTQYKFSETQLLIVFRNFINMPDIILTPFVLSAIISMTTANRDPESARLSAAILLPFLRTVIKHNEDERVLADYSVWCRDTLQRKQVDLEQVFTVLIDQNKEGNDVITPGLVNLAFMLLKAKQSPTLNTLAISFITKFIRKRFIFGRGIIKRIAKWMVVEQEQYQYSECLTMLSVADTFTVSECVPTIKYVMDFFLWVPGEQAMRMMSFILPILKLSTIVRDAFIEVLRKAINSSDVRTRRMAVYGFCMILKQLNNSNSRRSQTTGSSGYCTQQSISGFSLMTQSSFGSHTNPQRNFDMLTLEIIGLLRSCFTQSLDIKRTLYENLQRAVELNAKLVPHVLQFIDWHFRSYFDESTADLDDESLSFSIKYERLVYATDSQHMEVEIKDNLGCLIQFLAHCLVIFERINADYDTREMNRILNKAIEQIVAKHLHFEDTSGPTTHLKCALVQQQLNLIEGLIAYALLSSKQTNDIIKHILPLFKQHRKLYEGLKSLANAAKKSNKRAKNPNDDETTIGNLTVNGVIVKKINTEAANIWDLTIVEKLLRLLHEDIVPFAASEHTNALRSHVELVRYVLEIAANKVELIRLEPEYKQLAHSKRMLKYLTDITKVIFERCIKRLPALWRDFDMLTAVNASICFAQCLKTANETYKKRFKDFFVKGFDFYNIHHCKESPYIVQDIIDEFMQEDASAQTNEASLCKDRTAAKIPQMLLQSLEVLYDNIDFENRITIESYTWLLHFCRTYEVHNDELSLVHKLLFIQRQKTHSGAFFDSIAQILGNVLGTVTEDDDEAETSTRLETSLQLKSITTKSAINCLQHLYATLHKQIEDVDYFIVKANNLNYKCRIVNEDDRVFQRANLDALERAICTQLIHVSKTLLELTKVCIPLGACMDGLMRLLMQHYVCLKNLAKHFLTCCASGKISIKSTKFDLLLHVVGKPLPTNVYALIKYIEENILEDNKGKRINPQAEKAKVLRETKLIPKIILAIENFNKHGILLAKKTDNRLANMLHFGTVRDFRIKTADLKAAIERTFSHSSQIEVVISDLADQAEDNAEQNETDTHASVVASVEAESQALAGSDEENDDDAATSSDSNSAVAQKNVKKGVGTRRSRRLTSRSNEAEEQEQADNVTTENENSVGKKNVKSPTRATQLLKSLAKINQKSKKRTLYDVEQNHSDPDRLNAVEAPVEEPLAKRGRGRGRTRASKK